MTELILQKSIVCYIFLSEQTFHFPYIRTFMAGHISPIIWLIIMQVFMCDSFLWVLCGCCAKFSGEIDPKEPFWVHYVMEHSSSGNHVNTVLQAHLASLRATLTSQSCSAAGCTEEQNQAHFCMGSGCVPEIGHISITQTENIIKAP